MIGGWRNKMLVGGAVLGSAVAIVAGTVSGGGGGALTANLWMDTNGGTCVRQSTPAVYNDATACDSYDEAYTAASCGDTVRMVDGSTFTGYTNFTGAGASSEGLIDGNAKACTGGLRVTFDGGTNVTGGGLDWTDTDSITIRDITLGGETQANNNDKVVDLIGNDHLTLDNVNVDAQWKIVDGIGLSGRNTDITWQNSSICCDLDNKLVTIDDFSGPGTQQTDITFRNMVVRDQAYSTTSGTDAGGDVHAECWWLQNTTNFQLLDSITKNCISTGAGNWGGDGKNINLLWRNTVWGPSYGPAATDVVPGAGTGYRSSTPTGVPLWQGWNLTGTGTIEYSVFDGGLTLDNWSSLTWRGNIDFMQSCTSGVTYRYNRHTGITCGTGDVSDASALASGRFADSANADYRPANGSVAQINAGDPASCPATDLLGVARPIGGTCDQGAYEGP